MLKEITKLGRKIGTVRRRWFRDDYFDLIVSYDEQGQACDFQLHYNKPRKEYVFTWRSNQGSSHYRVHRDGEPPARKQGSIILVPDEMFPAEALRLQFEYRSQSIDPTIRRLVPQKLAECVAGRAAARTNNRKGNVRPPVLPNTTM